MPFPKEIKNLSELFGNLPNVGPKLSTRLALYLSVNAKDLAKKLENGLDDVIKNIVTCDLCGNVSNTKICDVCSNESRDQTILLIVEDSLDLYNIESTKEYSGMYHVLGGVLSPINGIGPDELRMDLLLKRLTDGDFTEVILALNPNLEGDTTSLYIKSQIEKIKPETKISRLAKGIPAGSDLEFLSGQTIIDSMKSRISL